MWTVEVREKTIRDGDLLVTLAYADGKTVIVETLRTHLAQSDTWLAEQAARRVQQLTDLYNYANEVQVGPLDYSVKPQPTADDEAKAAFSTKVRALRKLELLGATGIDVTADIEQVKQQIAADYAANPVVADAF